MTGQDGRREETQAEEADKAEEARLQAAEETAGAEGQARKEEGGLQAAAKAQAGPSGARRSGSPGAGRGARPGSAAGPSGSASGAGRPEGREPEFERYLQLRQQGRSTPEALSEIGESAYAETTKPYQREPEQREGRG